MIILFTASLGISKQCDNQGVLVTSKINDMASQGWELTFVNSGGESFAGREDDNGIYVTRYIFKRMKQ